MNKSLKFVTIEGIEVPYIPAQKTTVLRANGPEEKDLCPPYINNLETWAKNKSPRSFYNAKISAAKEMLIHLVHQSGLKVKAYEAPIAVSAMVPLDCVYLDYNGGRIVVNESQFLERAVDSDGDRAMFLFNADSTAGVLVKFPITMQPLKLTVIEYLKPEKLNRFGSAEAGRFLIENPPNKFGDGEDDWNEWKLFYKRSHIVPVGLITNHHNSQDLWLTKNLPYEERINTIFNTNLHPLTGLPQRYYDIEEGGLKAGRKDGKEFVDIGAKALGARQALAYQHAWALTSCSSISTMGEEQVNWVWGTDFRKLMQNILSLKVEFREVKPPEKPYDPPRFVEGQLFDRLKRFGLIGFKEYPHKNPNMPPSVMLYLRLPSGEPVALTDVKRDDKPEGLTFGFLIPPIFDCRTIYNEDGSVEIEPTMQWMHPIEHLRKCLTVFDSTIRSGENAPVIGYFPYSVDDWFNPVRGVKISKLQSWISDWAGQYGDSVPCTRDKYGKITPVAMAHAVAIASVAIDYGKPRTEEEMFKIVNLARKTCDFCIYSKGQDPEVRKYLLARPNGYGQSIFSSSTAQPDRTGIARSQLLRALKPVKMRIALVSGETKTQTFITPTGIAKQHTEEVFLPQVFTTLGDYYEHLEMQGLTEENCPYDVHDYKSWQAESRRCYTISGKSSIEVGKLVDPEGNKIMPLKVESAYAIEWDKGETHFHDIDLIFPIEEAKNKHAHHLFLRHAKEMDLVWGETTEKAMVLEVTFFRTGTGSENTKDRFRTCSFKGIDSFPIENQLVQLGIPVKRDIDYTFVETLQSAMISLFRKS